MAYQYLLWDIDNTILDFFASEQVAIKSLFHRFGLGECTDEMIARYSKINIRYWQALERGEMTKPEILVGRYREWFTSEGLDASCAAAFNEAYQLALGDTIVWRDECEPLLKAQKGHYVLAAITNGTQIAQKKKLKNSGLDQLFDYVFISEELGYEKPACEFFAKALAKMGNPCKEDCLVIGDSLTSDIKGGNNVGIDCCWYNPRHQENDKAVHFKYEIQNLWELESILGENKP